MTASDYHLVNHWRVYGTVEEVSEIFGRPGSELPRWWPAALFDAEDIEPGDENGVGRSFAIRARGWLPFYSLFLQFTALEVQTPNHYILGVAGDLHGTAAWTFEQDGDMVNVSFDWRVTVVQPLLQRLGVLIRPLFISNHGWIMLQGERSLVLELLRRNTPDADQYAIPEPPGAARLPLKPLLAANAAVAGAGALAVWRLRRR